MIRYIKKQRRPGTTTAGILGLAVASSLLLCGAGLTPTGTVQKADIDAGGHSLNNAGTVQATNVYANTLVVTNGFTPPGSYVLPKANGGTGTNAPGLTAGAHVTISGTWPNQTVNASATAWELVNTDFTAVAGHRYQVDSSAGAVTVMLPASATAMDEIEVVDATLSWDSHSVTLARNGLKINNGTTNYTASVPGNKLSVVYLSAGYGWSIK